MDANKDEKSIVERTVDVVKEFAATVSEAAHNAVKSKPANSEDEPAKLPTATTGFMDDAVAPQVIRVRKQKKTRKTHTKVARKTGRKTKSAKAAKSLTRRKSVDKRKSSKKKKTKKSRQ